MNHKIPYEIAEKLQANHVVGDQLRSVIWFGSTRNKQDVHERSDYDIQIVLDMPSATLTKELNQILQSYPFVDLSIMYMQDIVDKDKDIIFHDGTKGLFFMYVLSEANVIYGENVYAPILKKMDVTKVKSSVLLTIREYLSRLRVMAAQSPNDTMQFKKYSLKLFKDILAYTDSISFKEMVDLNNNQAAVMIQKKFKFSRESRQALKKITDYDHNFLSQELATLLTDFETLVSEIVNE